MANYTVKDPSGNTHVISGPDGSSDEEVLAQAQKLFPQKTDWSKLIGQSAKEAFTTPMRTMKDLATNPETQANLMPALLGTVGGISPIPGGSTMGTAAGQGIRDLSLKALGKPIPSGMRHAGE